VNKGGENSVYYLSLAVTVWMLVGFLVGLKSIYIDRDLSEKNIAIMKKQYARVGKDPRIVDTITTKRFHLTACTVMGFFTAYVDWKTAYYEAKSKRGIKR